jgi:hypothetical protein
MRSMARWVLPVFVGPSSAVTDMLPRLAQRALENQGAPSRFAPLPALD